MSEYCKKCGEYVFGSRAHRCPPAWLVWRDDEGETEEDGETFFGFDASTAVEAWAEEDDRESADYTIVQGSPARVWVKSLEPERAKSLSCGIGPLLFEVHGESVPSYTAYLEKDLSSTADTSTEGPR